MISKRFMPGFKAAYEYKGKPCAILVKTIKGYGLGTAGESMNIAQLPSYGYRPVKNI